MRHNKGIIMFERDNRHDTAILKCLHTALKALIPYQRNTLATIEVADIGCGFTMPYLNMALNSLNEIPKPFNFYLVDPALKDHIKEAQEEVNKIQTLYPEVCNLKICPYTSQKLLDEHLFKQLDIVIMIQSASLFSDKDFGTLLQDLRHSKPLLCIVVELNDKVTLPIYKDIKLHKRSVEKYMYMAAKEGFDHVVTEIQNAHGEPDGQLMAGMAFKWSDRYMSLDNLFPIAGVKPEISEQTGC